MIAQSNVGVHRDLAARAQGKINESLEVMRRLNLEGNVEKRLWDTINQMIKSDSEILDDHNSSIWEYNKEMFSIQKSLIQELSIRMPEIGEMQIKVISGIRKELGVSTSMESLRA